MHTSQATESNGLVLLRVSFACVAVVAFFCSAELADDKDEYVGSVSWSGIVTRHDTCGQCNLKDREAKSENIVKVNYQIVL
jgi:hypothetical protein